MLPLGKWKTTVHIQPTALMAPETGIFYVIEYADCRSDTSQMVARSTSCDTTYKRK